MKRVIIGVVSLSLFLTACEKEVLNELDGEMNTPESIVHEKKNDAKKLDVCHTNGQMLSLNINSVWTHLNHGDYLFDCNPSDGINLEDINNDLIRIAEENGYQNDNNGLRKAFTDWYEDEYLTGIWEENNSDPSYSDGGIGSGGVGGGSL